MTALHRSTSGRRVILGFRSGVNEVFALLGCHTQHILVITHVSELPIGPIFKSQAASLLEMSRNVCN